jgi:hypothetical protein
MASASDIAKAIGTDAKTFRRFVRSHLRSQGLDTAGKGHRYAFDMGDVDAIGEAFDAWRKGANVTIVSFADDGDDD